MNSIPNIITILRLPLAVTFFILFTAGSDSGSMTFVALAFLIAAGLTDAADGMLARRLQAESDFGRIIDPLLDKILVCGGFTVLLVGTDVVRTWMVIVILARELLVTALRARVEMEGFQFGAQMWGKAKMVVQWVAMVTVVAVEGWARSVPTEQVSRLIPMIAVWVATIVTALSAITYVIEARHTLGKQWSTIR